MVTYGNDGVFYRDWKKQYPVIDRGEGIYLYDEKGKRYIDATGGPCVVNIGHGVPEVLNAMVDQAKKVCFPYQGHFVSRAQIELANEIIALAPSGMSKVYFVSGGSEASEVALKLARQYHLSKGDPSRTKIIGRWQGYHGATIAAYSMSGDSAWRKDYVPYLLNFPLISPPYCYRCRFGKEYPSCGIMCAHELEKTIKQEGEENIAAFISEPISGGTLGAVVPPPEYYPIIREICDRYGILLVVDEVITGFGRTGKNFGIDHWGVTPDLIITGKGMGSGYASLGAVIVSEKVCNAFLESGRWSSFALGYTYSGNPLSCAVGLGVLRYLKQHDLILKAREMGNFMFKEFEAFKNYPMVGDIRGTGMLLGMELVKDKNNKTTFDRSLRIAEMITRKAFEKGLIIISGHGIGSGLVGDLLMVSPPFVIREEEIKEICKILNEVLQEVWEEKIKEIISK